MCQSMRKIDKNYQITELSYKVVGNRVYKLIRVVSSFKSSKKRSDFLHRLLEQNRAVGLIEWWTNGSIIKKSKRQFLCVLISRK